MTINASGAFGDGTNRYPNVIGNQIHIPDPRKKVTVDNTPALVDN